MEVGLEGEDEGEAGVVSSVASLGVQLRLYNSVHLEPSDMSAVRPERVEGNEWHPQGTQCEGLRVSGYIFVEG